MPATARENKMTLAYRIIRDHIAQGTWQPGERFSTFGLARRTGIGRTTINDAIRLLEKRGFVRILPNVGFEVRPLHRREVLEYLEARLEIERLLWRHLAERGDAEILREIREILSVARASARDENPEAAMQALEEFHRRLLGVLVSGFVQTLFAEADDMEFVLLWRVCRAEPASFAEILSAKEAVLDAVLERDESRIGRGLADLNARMRAFVERSLPEEEDRDA